MEVRDGQQVAWEEEEKIKSAVDLALELHVGGIRGEGSRDGGSFWPRDLKQRGHRDPGNRTTARFLSRHPSYSFPQVTLQLWDLGPIQQLTDLSLKRSERYLELKRENKPGQCLSVYTMGQSEINLREFSFKYRDRRS